MNLEIASHYGNDLVVQTTINKHTEFCMLRRTHAHHWQSIGTKKHPNKSAACSLEVFHSSALGIPHDHGSAQKPSGIIIMVFYKCTNVAFCKSFHVKQRRVTDHLPLALNQTFILSSWTIYCTYPELLNVHTMAKKLIYYTKNSHYLPLNVK